MDGKLAVHFFMSEIVYFKGMQYICGVYIFLEKFDK
jgi:hypothetical protein